MFYMCVSVCPQWGMMSLPVWSHLGVGYGPRRGYGIPYLLWGHTSQFSYLVVATEVGSMHPTGIHSCLNFFRTNKSSIYKIPNLCAQKE